MKFLGIVFFIWSQVSLAKPAPSPLNTANQARLKSEHSFDDQEVKGKYHFSDEAVTTVEEDKVLDSLLGTRTNFKDRIEQSAEQL